MVHIHTHVLPLQWLDKVKLAIKLLHIVHRLHVTMKIERERETDRERERERERINAEKWTC